MLVAPDMKLVKFANSLDQNEAAHNELRIWSTLFAFFFLEN